MGELSDHELAELAAERSPIDLGDEVSERGLTSSARGAHHRPRHALEVFLELAVTAARRGNLGHVLLRHSLGPVEALGVDRRRRRDRGGGDDAFRQ